MRNLVENRGVEPDICIRYNPTDYHEGKDPQLEKGIEVLKRQLGLL